MTASRRTVLYVSLGALIFAGTNVSCAEASELPEAQGSSLQNVSVLSSSSLESASDLVVAEGTHTVLDFSQASTVNLSGNIQNAGTIYVVSTNPANNVATVNFNSLVNAPGSLITSVLPAGGLPGFGNAISDLSLVFNATKDIFNYGTISSAANLSMVAGGVISNQTAVDSSSALVTAAGSLSFQTNTLVNSSIINSITNNVAIATLAASSQSITREHLRVFNDGGEISALNGKVILGSLLENIDVSVWGGDLRAQIVDVLSADGKLVVSANNLEGVLNTVGREAYVSSLTPTLNIGTVKLDGDPYYFNFAGNIVLSGSITAADFVHIYSAGDIIGTSTFTLLQAPELKLYAGILVNIGSVTEPIIVSPPLGHPILVGFNQLFADRGFALESQTPPGFGGGYIAREPVPRPCCDGLVVLPGIYSPGGGSVNLTANSNLEIITPGRLEITAANGNISINGSITADTVAVHGFNAFFSNSEGNVKLGNITANDIDIRGTSVDFFPGSKVFSLGPPGTGSLEITSTKGNVNLPQSLQLSSSSNISIVAQKDIIGGSDLTFIAADGNVTMQAKTGTLMFGPNAILSTTENATFKAAQNVSLAHLTFSLLNSHSVSFESDSQIIVIGGGQAIVDGVSVLSGTVPWSLNGTPRPEESYLLPSGIVPSIITQHTPGLNQVRLTALAAPPSVVEFVNSASESGPIPLAVTADSGVLDSGRPGIVNAVNPVANSYNAASQILATDVTPRPVDLPSTQKPSDASTDTSSFQIDWRGDSTTSGEKMTRLQRIANSITESDAAKNIAKKITDARMAISTKIEKVNAFYKSASATFEQWNSRRLKEGLFDATIGEIADAYFPEGAINPIMGLPAAKPQPKQSPQQPVPSPKGSAPRDGSSTTSYDLNSLAPAIAIERQNETTALSPVSYTKTTVRGFLFAPSDETMLPLPQGMILSIKTGAVVLVFADDSSASVINLHDEGAGDVCLFDLKGRRIVLHPGNQLIVSEKKGNEISQLSPIQGLAFRNASPIKKSGRFYIVSSEVSPAQILGLAGPIERIRTANDPRSRHLMAKIMKSSAALSMVHQGKGPFRTN